MISQVATLACERVLLTELIAPLAVKLGGGLASKGAGRLIPLIGGVIGGALDGHNTSAIADASISVFLPSDD